MIITLTTDFGLTDSYVGQMKGVILSIAPQVTIVDLCHGIRPQGVIEGAIVLESAAGCFPPGTIHVAIVDPTVGSGRAALAVQTDLGLFIGPDNGLFTAVLARWPARAAVQLTNPAFHRQPVSPTFHGRDIFAPVAAHLAIGTPLHALGEPATDLVQLDVPHPEPIGSGEGLTLHVLYADHFGNLVTDLAADFFDRWRRQRGSGPIAIRIGDVRIDRISTTYSDVCEGGLVAYFGSSGRLEIALRNGSAADLLHAHPGMPFELLAL